MRGSNFNGNILGSAKGGGSGGTNGGVCLLGSVIVFFFEGLLRILQEKEGELWGLGREGFGKMVCMVED